MSDRDERVNCSDPNKIMTSQETADFLQIPLQTLYKYASNGTGPAYYKIGKYARYTCREVMEWFNEHRVQQEEDPLLNAQETAKLLRWPIQRLEQAIKNGTAPPYAVNGYSKRWLKSEVIAWKDKQSSG